MYSGALNRVWRTATPPPHRGSPGSGGKNNLSDLHREAAYDGCFDVVQRFRVWDPPHPPAAAVAGLRGAVLARKCTPQKRFPQFFLTIGIPLFLFFPGT